MRMLLYVVSQLSKYAEPRSLQHAQGPINMNAERPI